MVFWLRMLLHIVPYSNVSAANADEVSLSPSSDFHYRARSVFNLLVPESHSITLVITEIS